MTTGAEGSLPPTVRRRAEFRRQGRVAFSPLPGAATALVILAICLPSQGQRLVGVFRRQLSGALLSPGPGADSLTVGDVSVTLRQSAFEVAGGLVPWLAAIWFCVWLQGLVQTRFYWNWRGIFGAWKRLNPGVGLGSLVGQQSRGRAVRICVLLGLAIMLLWGVLLNGERPAILSDDGGELPTQVSRFSEAIGRLTWRIAVVAGLIALADHAWEWWCLERALRMTPAELREELRQTEGNRENRPRHRREQ